ncbi:MAG: hypothetical protein KJO31_15570 [Gammaproteobacteria bacterium]|nr:hypothetical protein [Gammaproteobacteria bacterium]
MTGVLVLSMALGLNAAALATARMVLPAEFTGQSARIELAGFGGHNKGSYSLTLPAGTHYGGEFRRSESRLGIMDPLLVRNKGRGSFSFGEPGSESHIEAKCEFAKFSINVDVVTFDPKKVAYGCEFRSASELLAARLHIGQPKRQGVKQKFLARDLRAGEAVLFDQYLTFESVHDYQGTKLASQQPVGYVIRSGDRVAAAVELTDWNPGLYLAADLSADLQRAVLVTALAIAVFRDPAHSALEDD